jgi:hypothetical protein
MLGWEIIITNGDKKIASWMVGVGGTDWLRDLAKVGTVKDVAINCGYPHVFSAPAKVLIPILINGIPQKGGGRVVGQDYATSGNTIWDLQIDTEQMNQCQPEDVLTIDAWDQS